ncbi:CLUMA_CG014269, isoform A [Clunio marinus]|uniref:CLUMA_CG014269, isoform A n=1 Tax=Clunio marinus TaxID=568069 RepID=A0A1J1IMU1_9DIPT|nr:CLUMA_CG014269, isoform A [Clunio marinus]
MKSALKHSINYNNKLILAPMVRVGTLPMRLLALEYGADLVYTEELIDWKLMKCKRKVNHIINTIDFVDPVDNNVVFRTCDKEKEKVILQIGTASADRALETAKLVENDVAGIDINMGCPKEFSVKGGMGVALDANVENAKKILETLVSSLSIPVTCKIRIRKSTEETVQHVKELAATGIKAIAIHARNKDERPQHRPHPEVVKEVAEAVDIPVICNGGSKEIEKFSDILQFKKLCGVSSVMIARAAEWNVSIFRPKGMLPLMEVIRKYLAIAIDYDSHPANVKYCIQNMLRELQESEMGKRFLDAQTMEQIAEVFDMKDYCKQKQQEFYEKRLSLSRDIVRETSEEPLPKRIKVDNGKIEENIAFIRANYVKDIDLPKSILHAHTKKKLRTVPSYETEQKDRYFRATLSLGNKKYSSTFWEKNKKNAEQALFTFDAFRASNMTEILTLDYNVNPLWLNDSNTDWADGDEQVEEDREIIYCDAIGPNTELIFDENIPAEFEEEVFAEETFDNFVSSTESIAETPTTTHSRNLLLPQNEVKFKQTLTVNRGLLKTNQRHLEAQKSTDSLPPATPTVSETKKYREKVNFKPTNFVLNEHTMRIFKNKIKAIQKRKQQAIAREMKQRPKKVKQIKASWTPTIVKKVPVKKPEPVNYIPQKPKPIVDPKNSGEIVRVEKAESDIEVDILSNSEDDPVEQMMIPLEDDVSGSTETEEISVDDQDGSWMIDSSLPITDTDNNETQNKLQELKENDESTFKQLESVDIPDAEIILEVSNISNLERFLHSEFFVNRPTKTPERYLKIRNHIISMWNQSKPIYLSKTSARNGLKKCGDVNCISRIHSMLEQIGAINFNCPEVSWIRPLKILYEIFEQNIRNKIQSARMNSMLDKKQKNDENFTHSDDGSHLISMESSDSMVNRIKSRTMHRTQFELIKCQRFSKDNVAPFEVSINLSCLLCLYFHALSSKLEIMGFLGGKCIGNDKLILTRYKPCRTSNQTAINCEMCPVSQVEQSCNLLDEGLLLMGWFHSHPNFPPIPSRTDLKTQAEMQQQFAPNNPFIGFILSCVDMQFKCIYMQRESAYELDVEIINDYGDVRKDLKDVLNVIERDKDYDDTIQKFIECGNNLLRELSIPDNIQKIIEDYI